MDENPEKKPSYWRRLLAAVRGRDAAPPSGIPDAGHLAAMAREIQHLRGDLKEIRGLLAKEIKNNEARAKQNATFLSCTHDITALPPAKGLLRKKQLLVVQLLRVTDKLFKRNGIRYWIDYGSLLGARRHGGFIPWDDDLDIGVFRSDCEKIGRLEEEFKRHHCKLWVRYENGSVFLKISPLRYPGSVLDIFFYDTDAADANDPKARDALGARMKTAWEYRKQLVKTLAEKSKGKDFDFDAYMTAINQYRETVFYENTPPPAPDTAPTIILALDFAVSPNPRIFPREIILPLDTIPFEGHSIPAFNRIDDYLKRVYGDFMFFPSGINQHNINPTTGIPDDIDDITESLRQAVDESP